MKQPSQIPLPHPHQYKSNLLRYILLCPHHPLILQPSQIQIRAQTRREEHLPRDGPLNRPCGDDEPHEDADTG